MSIVFIYHTGYKKIFTLVNNIYLLEIALLNMDAQDLERRRLFHRYIRYIEVIGRFEYAKEKLDGKILSKQLNIAKQQSNPVLIKLEDKLLIERKEIPEWQERGGKSKFIFLTQYSKDLLRQSKDRFEESFQQDIDISEIFYYINKYYNARSYASKYRAIEDIYRVLSQLNITTPMINWNNRDVINDFIDQLLISLPNEDIRHRLRP